MAAAEVDSRGQPSTPATILDLGTLSRMEIGMLINYAKERGVAISITEAGALGLYPMDRDRDLVSVLLQRSEQVTRKLDPDRWMSKGIIGTWQVEKEEETTTAKFRKDGVLEIRRKHENILLGALNSVINGTIYYSWSKLLIISNSMKNKFFTALGNGLLVIGKYIIFAATRGHYAARYCDEFE